MFLSVIKHSFQPLNTSFVSEPLVPGFIWGTQYVLNINEFCNTFQSLLHSENSITLVNTISLFPTAASFQCYYILREILAIVTDRAATI